jgi:hypothetical protein
MAMRASGEMLSEASGFTAFATGVAQLEPLSAADAAQWVKYWSALGMFQ